MSDQVTENYKAVEDINRRFMADEITREQALKELQVIADRLNIKSKEIAKKYKVKARLIRTHASKSHGAKLE